MTSRFLPLIVSLLVVVPLHAQRYYRSDPLGLQNESIGVDEQDRYEWVLQVEDRSEGTLRILFRNGEEAERRLESTSTAGRELRVSQGGTLSSVERYDLRDRIVSEELYSGGSLTQRDEYEYADGLLLHHRRFDGSGERILDEQFHYWRDRSLRMVERSGDRRILFRYRDGLLISEEREEPEFRERYEYDQFGRTVARELWLDNEPVEEETRTYWGDPPAPVQRVEIVTGSITRVERYSEAGDLVGAERLADGTEVSNAERIVEDGRLVAERERRDGVLYVTSYSYDGDRLQEQESSADGALVERVVYYTDRAISRTQIIYRDGEALLEVDYDGERRVEERVVRDGSVVRVRTFEPEDEL